jgi:ribosome recycling factor
LIKLLKQSTFIVGKAIDAKDIKVVSKPITVAGRQFNVNNSVNTFTLPIQKTTEREIFDFIDTYTTTVQTGSSVSDMISSLLNDSGNSVQEEEEDESVVEEDNSNAEGGEVIEE